jgi:endonuclease YncB( thermonuclease family)
MITRWIGMLFALVLWVYFGAPAPALAADPQQPVLTGTVTRVVDGDTVVVELSSGPFRVRLYGIDAPESTQPGGGESTSYLTKRILHQKVELEPFQQDRYDRLIAIVDLGDEDINETMVQTGHAWAFRKYLKHSDTDYCYYEADARKAHLGLWSLPAAQQVAPWEYRHHRSGGPYTDYTAETAERCITALGVR